MRSLQEENVARVKLLIQHVQRQRLKVNPIKYNEYPKLELYGAWEPLCMCSSLSLSEGKSSQGFVSDGDKTNCG